MQELPGSLWINRGRWNWRVRLPGAARRTNIPVRRREGAPAMPESVDRGIAEAMCWRIWERACAGKVPKAPAAASAITVDDVAQRYLSWAAMRYRDEDGHPTTSVENTARRVRFLSGAKGAVAIANLGYSDFLDLRDAMVTDGLGIIYINDIVRQWRRMFEWALDRRLVDARIVGEIKAMRALQEDRAAAARRLRSPARHRDVKALLPWLPESIGIMVQLQELCGARAGEIVQLRPMDIEKRHDVWLIPLKRHKMAHKGQGRTLVLGPRAIRLLAPLVARTEPGEYLIHPARSTAERPIAGQTYPHGAQYTPGRYTILIRQAFERAERAGLGMVRWTSHELRYACGTRVRRKFGPDAARAVLGHAGQATVTDIYTRQAIEQEDLKTAMRAMRVLG